MIKYSRVYLCILFFRFKGKNSSLKVNEQVLFIIYFKQLSTIKEMLLTFLYMIATIMQTRRIAFLKAHLDAVFKGNQNRPSITLRITSSRRVKKGNFYRYTYATVYYITKE